MFGTPKLGVESEMKNLFFSSLFNGNHNKNTLHHDQRAVKGKNSKLCLTKKLPER